MKRVYVAGPYSSDNVVGVLDNMRRGMRKAVEILLAGYAPFTPWHDYHHILMLRGDEVINVEDCYNYSMAWLEVADAVYVLPNSHNSKGVKAELQRALELGIPICTSIDQLQDTFAAIERHNARLGVEGSA